MLLKSNYEALRMDFTPRRLHTFPSNIPIPFYMTYPGYPGTRNEQEILRDLEYLQEVYPEQVRRYQRKVAEILDKMDYEGSMIYDEYPDKYCLQRLAKTVTDILKKEAKEENADTDRDTEKWKLMEYMIQVLICNEIYKRRHGGKRAGFWLE